MEKNPGNKFKVTKFLLELVFAVLHHKPTGLGAIHGEA